MFRVESAHHIASDGVAIQGVSGFVYISKL